MSGPSQRPGADQPVVLPEPVRLRLAALASDALATLKPDEVPATLRLFVRFAPQRRVKLAAAPLVAAVTADPAFRAVVATRLRDQLPEAPAAADPIDVAAAAFLLRPAGWEAQVAAAGQVATRTAGAAQTAAASQAVSRLTEQLAATRAAAKADADRFRGELDQVKAEVSELRRKLHEARERTKRTTAMTEAAEAATEAARAEAATTQARADAELRRLKARLADAEQAVESARRVTREGRSIDDIRLRLLLDTVLDAAQGLRRELALPPVTIRPADTVPAVTADAAGVDSVTGSALPDDDPALLDRLLALPQAHLVVDGYNVTKSGFGALPLEGQRARLIAGLSALAAQSGAEITCVFDGAALTGPVPSASTRGVRVAFSKPGEMADDLIRRMVRAEPAGRPVVVVSSDREVAEGVRRVGARALPSTALLRRLARS